MKLFSIRVDQLKLMIVVAKDEAAAEAFAMREMFLPAALDFVHRPDMSVLELGVAKAGLPEGVIVHGDCSRLFVRGATAHAEAACHV